MMASTNSIVILGAGGDGQVIAEAIRQAAAAGSPIRLAGFLDDATPAGELVDGLPVVGRLDEWPSADPSVKFIPAIQKARDMPRRAARIDGLGVPRERWGSFIHPSAVVASSVTIGAGVYVAACATVQPHCRIGDFASLRGGAALGHSACVGRHAYVGPNAVMCGHTVLGEGAHLGPGAVLVDFRKVGRFAVVGIATAVTKDVRDYAVMMGIPARRVGFVKPLETAATGEQ
jgi:sugar O-acyltransferase (sialic acid O-acetyltransferase NeuD family)